MAKICIPVSALLRGGGGEGFPGRWCAADLSPAEFPEGWECWRQTTDEWWDVSGAVLYNFCTFLQIYGLHTFYVDRNISTRWNGFEPANSIFTFSFLKSQENQSENIWVFQTAWYINKWQEERRNFVLKSCSFAMLPSSTLQCRGSDREGRRLIHTCASCWAQYSLAQGEKVPGVFDRKNPRIYGDSNWIVH